VPLGYRSIFTATGDEGATDMAAGQFRSWLRYKELDADATTPGLHEVGEETRLIVTELRPADGSHTLRYRLSESVTSGDWVTTVTARDDGRGPGWIWVDVQAPAFDHTPESSASGRKAIDRQGVTEGEPVWTGVPRLVRNILGVTNARDGELVLAERPRTIWAEDFDDLIETICDPSRRGAAIVAAPAPGVAMPVMLDLVARLTWHCVGLAGTYVLDDEAAEALTRALGPSHDVPPGALRTYLPDADPASAVDARRHRIMQARTIDTGPEGKLARTLGWATRARSFNLPLPPQIMRVDRLLAREEPAAVLRSLHIGPSVSPATDSAVRAAPEPPDSAEAAESKVVREATEIVAEAARAAETADREAARTGQAPVEEAAAAVVQDVTTALEPVTNLVRELAGELSGDEPAALTAADLVSRLRQLMAEGTQALRGQAELSRRVSELQGTVEEIQDERDEARARLEEEQLDHAETEEEARRLRFEANQLRAALAAAAAPPESWLLDEPPQPPASFEDLLARLEDGVLAGVIFTGNPDPAIDLDTLDPFGTWAAKAWEMLQAVSGYAQARMAGEFSGGLHLYLSNTPPGRPGYSAGTHASQESESVEQSARFRIARELPVPTTICPEGKIFMGAHFKIAKKGLMSPRMYYYDDTAYSGNVYIGYIGRHMRNTLTN
jgi:hypothetical protein